MIHPIENFLECVGVKKSKLTLFRLMACLVDLIVKSLKSSVESRPIVTMTLESDLHLKLCRLMFLQKDLGNLKEHLRVWDIVESFLASNLVKPTHLNNISQIGSFPHKSG